MVMVLFLDDAFFDDLSAVHAGFTTGLPFFKIINGSPRRRFSSRTLRAARTKARRAGAMKSSLLRFLRRALMAEGYALVRPTCKSRNRRVVLDEMPKSAPEPPPDCSRRNIVTAFLHALTHAGNGDGWIRQPEIMEINSKPATLRTPQQSQVSKPTQSAFQSKRLLAQNERFEFREQQTSRFDRGGFRRQG